MAFEFYNPCKITAGENKFSEIGKICAKYGKKFLVITHKSFMLNNDALNILKKGFEDVNIDYLIFSDIKGEPTVELLDKVIILGREFCCDAVLAIGGGSVIDTAKAAAGLIVNGGRIKEYLEGVGTGRKMENAPLAFIAVPTTAGTGAEATKNAVISDKNMRFKKSFRDGRLFAKEIIIDPLLELSTPKNITAYSGMDAVTQLIESYTSVKSTPFSEFYALNGLSYAKELKNAYDDGNNIPARFNMAVAALMSGIALSNGGLGAAHGVAASLGVNLGISHGYACAVMLPNVIKLNSCVIKKYSHIAKILCGSCGSEEQNYNELINYIKNLNEYFGIPNNLKGYKLSDEAIMQITRDSYGSSMSGNPLQLNEKELFNFIKSIS